MNAAIFSVNAKTTKYETLFHRHPANPILTGKNWPSPLKRAFNSRRILFPRRSRSVFGCHGGFQEFRKIWCRHATGRQRRSASASKDQWILGVDPSAHDATRSSHLDLLLSRFASLGKP